MGRLIGLDLSKIKAFEETQEPLVDSVEIEEIEEIEEVEEKPTKKGGGRSVKK